MTAPELTKEQKLKVMALREEGLTREEAIADVLGTTYMHPQEEEEVIVECIDARKNVPEMTTEKKQEFIDAGIMAEDEPIEVIDEPTGQCYEADGTAHPTYTPAVVQAAPQMPATPRQTGHKLTMDEVKKYICPTATDQEAYTFMQLCNARGLNPFTKEAYLIKYGGSANMVVGKDAFTRKAEDHPSFDGFEAGIIVQSGDNIERRQGCFKTKDEKILGGWSKVYRSDRTKPYTNEVTMEEYSSGKSNWMKMPATMIRKVALVQSLREAFPSELGGCYDSSEMGE